MRLIIQHDKTMFSPPVQDGVKIEYERTGTPGKMTFTTIKVSKNGMSFFEGDVVRFYYDENLIFQGYVFTKKRDREHHIKVTCYDQLRYLKNKFSYVFEQKSGTEIVRSLCNDFGLNVGTLDSTNYVMPSMVEENTTAFDIILKVLDETLLNTGKMYVVYDDCGKITLKNCENMKTGVMINSDTAENFDYSSSIDEETYNSVVLYYDGSQEKSGSKTTSSDSNGANAIIQMARTQIGTSENPLRSNNVKYNTEYYGGAVSGSAYPWCCVFVWWLFRECGLSSLFYGGQKTASCPTAMAWFRNQGRWISSDYHAGDVVFFDWSGNGVPDHVGIIEAVNSDGTLTTIEGNTSDKVLRMERSSQILGAGRPNYSSTIASNSDSPAGEFYFLANDVNGFTEVQSRDTSYCGTVLSLSDVEKAAVMRTISYEFGGDLAGSMLIAQVIRDEVTCIPGNTVKKVIQTYFEPYGNGTVYYTGSTDPGISNQTNYNNALQAVNYIFLQGNSAYPKKLLSYALSGTDSAFSSWPSHPTIAATYRYGNTTTDLWTWENGTVSPTLASTTTESADTSNRYTTGQYQVFGAQNDEKIREWGLLRYVEKIDTPSIGSIKAKQLLDLYCKKTRELKVKNAFGSTEVRAGTLIPVRLNLGDIITNNYMLVDKVTHNFSEGAYTMDMTLEGAWED